MLDLDIPDLCGQEVHTSTILVRWSGMRALHVTLAPCWPCSSATGYTKAISKLALGPSFAFTSGSCMNREVATKRLAIIAAYLQAVLEKPRLRKNLDVQVFLKQGRVHAQACSTKAAHDMVTWATITTPTGQEHVAVIPATTPDASTGSSNAFYSQALPGSPAELAPTTPTEEPLPPLPPQQMASSTLLPPLSPEENVSKAMHFLVFDSRLLAHMLRPSDLCSFSQTGTEWRAAVDGVKATALRPNIKIPTPAPVQQELKGLSDHLTVACKTMQIFYGEKGAGFPTTLTQAAQDVGQNEAWELGMHSSRHSRKIRSSACNIWT